MPDQRRAQDRSVGHASGAPSSWKLTDAKAQFSRVVQRALDGEPQRIVRGSDAVIVVAEPDYERATRRGRTAIEVFSALRGAGLELGRDPDVGAIHRCERIPDRYMRNFRSSRSLVRI
jgi:prevent-host-death family protein